MLVAVATPRTNDGVNSPTVLIEFLGNQVTVSPAITTSAIPSTVIRRVADGYWVVVHIPFEPEDTKLATWELLQVLHPPSWVNASSAATDVC